MFQRALLQLCHQQTQAMPLKLTHCLTSQLSHPPQAARRIWKEARDRDTEPRQFLCTLALNNMPLIALLDDEEMLRERRGGEEPPPPPSHLGKGLALVDASTYESMLPDERLEVSLFGFKLAVATTPANTRTA